MSNMSYCRFQNTLQDLNDCYNYINDIEDMGKEERRAREKLIQTCRDIVDEAMEEDEGGE